MVTQNFLSWKRRIGLWGIGHMANFLMVRGFNLVLYPAVIWYFGLIWGASVMWFLSLAVCYLTLLFYDWCKIDWLGIETLKEVREAEETGILHRFIKWTLSKGDTIAVLALSLYWDPFICVVYMRQGAHQYNGMTRRDWEIFLVSFLISNAWWTTVVFTGLTVGEWVLRAVRAL
ncbi:MAG: hypothetical protein U1C12_01415 [Patescibacteria group bacterium]|nr:hypothetical protein [Patescibacteria group bacterium]